MSLTVNAQSVAPFALAVDAAGNNVFQPDETVIMAPTWRNTGTVAIALTGATSAFTGPPGATYTNPDASADLRDDRRRRPGSACTDCYTVNVTTATRPLTHWDSTILETVTPTSTTKTWTLHIGDSFTDVPPANGFYRFVETILHKNVTGGCTPTTYCPSNSTTREQMAVFVLVSKEPAGYVPPACGATPHVLRRPGHQPLLPLGRRAGPPRRRRRLRRRPVLPVGSRHPRADGGLRPAHAGPDAQPARVRAAELFADVPETSGFCRWIEELARRGVVTGCGGVPTTAPPPTSPASR